MDTTILRGLMFGTHAYRTYLRETLGDRFYVGRFVDMEFKRGVLIPLISFFKTLAMPHMKTIGDAEKTWSHSFKTREVKLILALSGEIFDKHKLDRTKAGDKTRGLMGIATAIKQYDRRLRNQFVAPSHDRTHCVRGVEPLRAAGVGPQRTDEYLSRYFDQFQDVDTCRNACRIDRFFQHHESDVDRCVRHSETLPNQKQYRGVFKVRDALRKIQSDATVCSCRMCERVGDVVISVGAPRHMRVETSDASFPHWCKTVGQPHRILTAELKFLNDLRRKEDTT